ncbi:MAG: alpha/beta fold hydrolase, partial [Acidobacteriaceae bacterium]|nr:alpha/beta fold hydrolase [Acidobacteriaceae bacterium]
MSTIVRLALCPVILLGLSCASASAAGPWDLHNLKREPRVDWIQREGPIRSLYYEGEPFRGKPTRVFAYFAFPDHVTAPVPAMVLVHGGGGHAFPEWATMWAQRGYAAIAMDLSGNGPEGKPLPDGGPQETDHSIFYESIPPRDAWVYHAVSTVIRAISFLERQPEVDPRRIGITGISWGGFLTDIVAGLDDRLKLAIPVYGCGFIYSDSVWATIFKNFAPELRQSWIANFDPSRYLANARMPMLWIAGTNDFAYPLDSLQQSYRLPVGPRHLRVTIRMAHGHR